MTLSFFRLGMPTRQSHTARHSGFKDLEAFKLLTALQQAVGGVLTSVVIKGMHGAKNTFFAISQSKPFTGFVAATVRSNRIAKGTKDPDTLFILSQSFTCVCFLDE